jgi:hypothetical protein
MRIALKRLCHSCFVVSYITGAGVPSDHLPVGTMNTSLGSGSPLNCGFSISGDCGRSAPHALPSRPKDYFCPVLTADGKLDCAPK